MKMARNAQATMSKEAHPPKHEVHLTLKKNKRASSRVNENFIEIEFYTKHGALRIQKLYTNPEIVWGQTICTISRAPKVSGPLWLRQLKGARGDGSAQNNLTYHAGRNW